MSISGITPHRVWTCDFSFRRLCGSAAGGSGASLIAPCLRSAISSQPAFGSAAGVNWRR
jgi:hypothetical protein